jgi:hypothetical protein
MTMVESMIIKRLKEVSETELSETDSLKKIFDFSLSAYKRFLNSGFTIDREGIYNFCKQNNYSFFTYKCIDFLFSAYEELSRENPRDMAE